MITIPIIRIICIKPGIWMLRLFGWKRGDSISLIFVMAEKEEIQFLKASWT